MKFRWNKWVNGPGGVRCPCCRRGDLKEAKRRHNRLLRRRQKQSLKAEVICE